jgi:uncharacterized protein YutE (UPF0331/DUF86 family)
VTELDRALVRRKLARISRNVRDLESVVGLTLEDYRRDRFRQKAIERLLQETIEAAVDANQHLLAALGQAAATDYFDSFVEVGRAGVIPEASARALAPAAGLRNRLVHEYDAIDDAIVLAAVGPACRQFSEYVASVEAYLSAGERR